MAGRSTRRTFRRSRLPAPAGVAQGAHAAAAQGAHAVAAQGAHAAASRDASRADRERRIREIIARQPVGTQEELAAALRGQGLAVTQATVSRDIKRLGLVKAPSGDGRARYLAPARPSPVDVLRRLRLAVDEYVLSIDAGEDLVVIHTLTGCANAVAEAIDEMEWGDVVGTVAGDNTILVVPRRRAARHRVLGRLRDLIEGGRAAHSR